MYTTKVKLFQPFPHGQVLSASFKGTFVRSFRREGYCWFEWLNIALYPPSPWSVQHNPLPCIPITTHGPSKHTPLLNRTFHNALNYNNGSNYFFLTVL